MVPSLSGKASEEITMATSTDVVLEEMTSSSPMAAPSSRDIIYLNLTTISVAIVLLWILCCCANRIILHKTQQFYASRSPNFRQLIEFVATIDLIFSTIFILYYFANLMPTLVHSNSINRGRSSPAPNRICYELNKGIGEWVFNVAFTAGIVAILRQSLLALLYQKQEKCCQNHQGHLRTLANHMFTVNTWRNSWALALLVLLLAGPWMATSAVLERIPEVGKLDWNCISILGVILT